MLVNNIPGLPKDVLRSVGMTSSVLSDFDTLTKDGLFEIKMNASTLHAPMTIVGSLEYTATIEVHKYQVDTSYAISHTIKFVGTTTIYTYYRIGIIGDVVINWSDWRKEVEDIPVFTPATEDTEGINGLVPAPTVDDAGKFLKSDGTWASAATGESVVAALGYKPAKVTVSDEYVLTVSDWENDSQTLLIEHDLNDVNSIDVMSAYISEWFVSGVYADSETATSITFKCNAVPTTDLKFKITSSTVA